LLNDIKIQIFREPSHKIYHEVDLFHTKGRGIAIAEYSCVWHEIFPFFFFIMYRSKKLASRMNNQSARSKINWQPVARATRFFSIAERRIMWC